MGHRTPRRHAVGELRSAETWRVPVSATLTASQPWKTSLPWLTAGGVSIVAGGLVAAVTGPTGWDHGSWVAAFLVLVAGVAQIGVGAGQAQLAPIAPTVTFAAAGCVLWNAGGAAIIAGTLLSSPVTVSIGSTLLLGALGMTTFAVRGSGCHPLWFLLLFRVLLVVLLASIPIGIALAWTRG